MNKRSALSIVLASLMVLSLASCQNSGSSSTGSSNPSSDSTSVTDSSSSQNDEEPYLIHMVIPVAAEGTGADQVREAVNALTLQELNMEMDLQMQTLGTLNNTLNMQMAANGDLDIITIPSTILTSSIDSGYLRNLNEYTDYLAEAIEG